VTEENIIKIIQRLENYLEYCATFASESMNVETCVKAVIARAELKKELRDDN
jgi:hypothetical protein